jgi:hypothetical protein
MIIERVKERGIFKARKPEGRITEAAEFVIPVSFAFYLVS